MDENTIEINWEDAPEGTTHYDPNDKHNPWMKHFNEGWYYFDAWGCWADNPCKVSLDTRDFVPKPETTVDSYTDPKADPFNEALKEKQSEEAILALYLEAINSKVAQDETEVTTMEYLNELFSGEKTKWVSVNGDIKSCVSGEGTVTMSPVGLGLCNELFLEQIGSLREPKSTRASWYDYDKEELTGLPEKGEIVYDRHIQEDVAYLGKLFDEDTVILEAQEGRCYARLITHLKPLNYKDSPKRQARKEQHKLLEDLVGDVDSNLQGMTHKGGAIVLYNKGWRVSKEDV